MLDAGEEHLRRWLLAECLKKDIEPSDIVRCIQNINYGDAIAVKDWLQGSSSSGIISLLPLLSSCLEEIGIDISPREMRGQIEFLQG